MKLDAIALPYVSGEKFHDAYALQVQQSEVPQERMNYVEQLVRGRRVLHIGCLDHVPLIESRIQADRWFHGRLTKAAQTCLGVDIDRQGVEFVRSHLGITNIESGDITASQPIEAILGKTAEAGTKWDYVVFGEVLEHIDNPVFFLKQFLTTYGSQVGQVIITVPNAFRASNIRQAFQSLEVINTDHRYWFTPFTIWKVMHQAGLTVETLQMCKFDYSGNPVRERIRDFILQRAPLLAESIVVICRPM
jgi:2-polyprenyl-3-methyl-5-hydroxy-6-metoxy-1,4-benzoquinol methylase